MTQRIYGRGFMQFFTALS